MRFGIFFVSIRPLEKLEQHGNGSRKDSAEAVRHKSAIQWRPPFGQDFNSRITLTLFFNFRRSLGQMAWNQSHILFLCTTCKVNYSANIKSVCLWWALPIYQRDFIRWMNWHVFLWDTRDFDTFYVNSIFLNGLFWRGFESIYQACFCCDISSGMPTHLIGLQYNTTTNLDSISVLLFDCTSDLNVLRGVHRSHRLYA